MTEINGHTYSKTSFDDYKIRYKFTFNTDDTDYMHNQNIYSTCLDKNEVFNNIKNKMHSKVYNLEIYHTATKEQDDRDTLFIEETLKDI